MVLFHKPLDEFIGDQLITRIDSSSSILEQFMMSRESWFYHGDKLA